MDSSKNGKPLLERIIEAPGDGGALGQLATALLAITKPDVATTFEAVRVPMPFVEPTVTFVKLSQSRVPRSCIPSSAPLPAEYVWSVTGKSPTLLLVINSDEVSANG